MKKLLISTVLIASLALTSITVSAQEEALTPEKAKAEVDLRAERVRICFNHKVVNFDEFFNDYLASVRLYVDTADPVKDCDDMLDVLNMEKFWLDLLARDERP